MSSRCTFSDENGCVFGGKQIKKRKQQNTVSSENETDRNQSKSSFSAPNTKTTTKVDRFLILLRFCRSAALAVVQCPSVRCPTRSCIVPKRVNIFSTFFYRLVDDIVSRFDRILACDGRTDRQKDRQTSFDSTVHAMHSIVRYKWYPTISSVSASYRIHKQMSQLLKWKQFFMSQGSAVTFSRCGGQRLNYTPSFLRIIYIKH